MQELKQKSSLRQRVEKVKFGRCKNLIVVLEDPRDLVNTATAIRNVNALGAEKVYVVDPAKKLPDDWLEMRGQRELSRVSASAIKWTYVKRFDDTESCLMHLKKKGFTSIVTSPHVKGKKNVDLDTGRFTHTKLAVWFGNEIEGISDLAIEASELCVNIPMFGIIESLNLGTCTGIVLYEITKQRRAFIQKMLAKKLVESA
jgi:tRNA (guanosine-2'-O-)-methyltransferase